VSLVRRTVTPRVMEANRLNARRSTGPRSPQAKANVRLNALRHGRYSAILDNYFRLWFNAQVACAPRDPRPRWNPATMPIPILTQPGYDQRDQERMREFLSSVMHYVRPGPSPAHAGARGASSLPKPQRRAESVKKNKKIRTINATKSLKTKARQKSEPTHQG
jgi:hypothetical protein